MQFDQRLRTPEIDRLFEAMMTLGSVEECHRFFQDLCTVTEIKTMAQRFRAAELLYGGAKYEEVADATGMSSATISRIKRFINYGSDGYSMVIERLGQADDEGI